MQTLKWEKSRIEIATFLTGGFSHNVLPVGKKYEFKVRIVPLWFEKAQSEVDACICCTEKTVGLKM